MKFINIIISCFCSIIRKAIKMHSIHIMYNSFTIWYRLSVASDETCCDRPEIVHIGFHKKRILLKAGLKVR